MSEKTDSFLPLFGRDFLAATMGWTDSAVGAYIRLLIVQWEQGSIPADLEEIAAIAPSAPANWKKLEPKFPILEDGQRRNRRLEEHRAKADALKAFRSEAGRAGGRRTQANRKQNSSNASILLEANGQANCQAKSKPPSPSPSPSPSGEIQPAAPDATSEPPKRRKRSQPTDSISWTPAGGWEGIEPADRQAWATAYPAVDLARELAAAGEWLKANPAKAKKSRWRAFVTSWLSRSQERGGGRPSNRPGDAAPARAWADRATWRDDACRNMTDSQHRAWRAAQRPTQAALDIAGRLSVPAGDNG